MKIIDKSDPKTKEYLEKIGEVITMLSHLEGMMEFVLWEFIGAKGDAGVRQTIGRHITHKLEFMQKADLLRALIIERYGEEKGKEFTLDIYKNLQKCCEARNDMAHSLWFIRYGVDKDNLQAEKINTRDAFERGKRFNLSKARKSVELKELEDAIKLMDDMSLKVIEFGLNLLDRPDFS
ncbi:MAG: hypothetical protein HY425_01845 [Candidatus Levybacteria bacterium]|nr:hypothetical protein [Candidatus Levybacteria bacterium]